MKYKINISGVSPYVINAESIDHAKKETNEKWDKIFQNPRKCEVIPWHEDGITVGELKLFLQNVNAPDDAKLVFDSIVNLTYIRGMIYEEINNTIEFQSATMGTPT